MSARCTADSTTSASWDLSLFGPGCGTLPVSARYCT